MGPAAPLKRGPPPSYCPPFFQGRSARDVPPLPIEVRSSPPSPPCASAHNFTTKSPRLRPCARAKERSPWPLQTSTPSRYSSRSIIVSQVRGRVPLLGGREGGKRRARRRSVHPPSGAPLATELPPLLPSASCLCARSRGRLVPAQR